MIMQGKMLGVIGLYLGLCIMPACGKSPSNDPASVGPQQGGSDDEDDGGDESQRREVIGDALEGSGVVVAGTLSGLALVEAGVTHVIALDTEAGSSRAAELASDGTFELDAAIGGTTVLAFVNASETGTDMLVSRFATESLDTIAPREDATDMDLGDVDVDEATASTEATHEDLLASMDMSASAAETLGAVDDVSLRYLNPDIDGNGELDVIAYKHFILDFHNRFSARTTDGTPLDISDMENAFYPDDVVFSFSGSSIVPEMEKREFDAAPADYTWTFSEDTVVTQACLDGVAANATLPAGQECTLAFEEDTSYERYQLDLGVAVPKNGTYTLQAGGKTFTWTQVQVSDFSAGEGFIALFLRMDVDAGGDLTGISYKWQKKGTSGTYTLATEEELELVVKDRGFLSLKIDGGGANGSVGVTIPLTPSGSIDFAEEVAKSSGSLISLDPDSVLTEEDLADGVPFTRFLTNPGISYDDKLGMRFFF